MQIQLSRKKGLDPIKLFDSATFLYLFKIQDLDYQRHMTFSFSCSLFWEERWLFTLIIGEIVHHHFLRQMWRDQKVNPKPQTETEEGQTTQRQREKRQKDRQHNGKEKKDKRTDNDLPNTTQKAKDRTKRTPTKTGDERRCSGRVSSSCFTCDTRRLNFLFLVTLTVHWMILFNDFVFCMWLHVFCLLFRILSPVSQLSATEISNKVSKILIKYAG